MNEPKNSSILFHEHAIKEVVAKIGLQITTDYKGRSLVVLGVLKGSFVFLADLIRHIDLDIETEFIQLASYDGAKSSGKVTLNAPLKTDLRNHHVIIVEDIIDTGTTLDYLLAMLKGKGPASVRVCAFLSKPSVHKNRYTIDYQGFEIANEFVVGYGLDYRGRYRNCRHVYQIKV